MTSHLLELARRTPADAQLAIGNARAVAVLDRDIRAIEAVQVEPPGS